MFISKAFKGERFETIKAFIKEQPQASINVKESSRARTTTNGECKCNGQADW